MDCDTGSNQTKALSPAVTLLWDNTHFLASLSHLSGTVEKNHATLMLPAEVWSWDCLMLKCQSLHSVTNIWHYRCQTFIHLFWNKSHHWDPVVIQEIDKHNRAQQASFQAISATQASYKMRALWWQPLSLCKLLFPHNSSFSRLFHPASSFSPLVCFLLTDFHANFLWRMQTWPCCSC